MLIELCVFAAARTEPFVNKRAATSKKNERRKKKLATCTGKTLGTKDLVQPDGWARGEREGYGGPRDVTSLSLKEGYGEPCDVISLSLSLSQA